MLPGAAEIQNIKQIQTLLSDRSTHSVLLILVVKYRPMLPVPAGVQNVQHTTTIPPGRSTNGSLFIFVVECPNSLAV
jgi:hypothetical protein